MSAIASGVPLLLCNNKLKPFSVVCKLRRAFPRKLVVIVQGRLFLFKNRSIVLLMISFRKLTALPRVCLGSLSFHLGDGVHFLGDKGVV